MTAYAKNNGSGSSVDLVYIQACLASHSTVSADCDSPQYNGSLLDFNVGFSSPTVWGNSDSTDYGYVLVWLPPKHGTERAALRGIYMGDQQWP